MITNIVAAVLLAGSPAAVVDPALAAKALALVQRALETEQRWTKVHAAEALLAVGRRGDAARAFERELAQHVGEPQYRIGIRRVLAQAAGDQRVRQRCRCSTTIADAFLDTAGPDRLHASETLGKLAYRAKASEIFGVRGCGPRCGRSAGRERVVGADNERPRRRGDAPGGASRPHRRRIRRRNRRRQRGRRRTPMRFLPALSPSAGETLAAAAARDDSVGIAAASLVGAAFVHASGSRKPPLAAALERRAHAGDADVKTEVCDALAMAGDEGAVPLLTTLLNDASIDVRIAAAHALLQIDTPYTHGTMTATSFEAALEPQAFITRTRT